LFTSQEQTVLKVLTAAVVAGIIIGSYRQKLKDPQSIDSNLDNLVNAVEIEEIENKNDFATSSENTVRIPVRIININTAEKPDLEQIPGVGPVTAERILLFRTKFGKIKGFDDLEKIKGIGPRTTEKLRPYVTF